MNMMKTNVYKQISKNVGLDKCCWFFKYNIPLEISMRDFFFKIRIQIFTIHGNLECCGIYAFTAYDQCNSCGLINTSNGYEVNLNNDDDQEKEIQTRGSHVFIGYLNNPQQTISMINNDDWLNTGEIVFS